MLADRYRERLAGLDHEALLSYATELSTAHRHEADVLLAKHSPLPAWARDEVLLSADLLPDVFATLQMTKCAELLSAIEGGMDAVGVDIKTMNAEYGDGQLEITMAPARGITACDNAATFRTGVKARSSSTLTHTRSFVTVCS